jgi:RNA-directed DNA polymerase
MSLTTPCSVQKLQTALHAKAKESPNFRFHALYDKGYRKDVLAYAYERCRANGGAAGVDNQTFENIEAYGRERWLDELTQELKSRTYQPQPTDNPGSGCANGGQAGTRTYLRGRPAAGAICLSG